MDQHELAQELYDTTLGAAVENSKHPAKPPHYKEQ